jgi:hypothetical protein
MAKSAGYKLATYQASDGPRAGLVIDDKVFDAATLTRKPAYASVLGILADWRGAEGALRKAAASVGKGAEKRSGKAKSRPLAKTKLLAPVRFPSAIYAPARTTPTTPRKWRRATAAGRRPIRTRWG